jgi:ankyrin repeat protein
MNIMKKVGLLALVMFGIAQVSSAAEDYSKMSAHELNEAFIIAVQRGSCDEVQKLVQAGADINTIITYIDDSHYDCSWEINTTALRYAVAHNNLNMVKILLKVEKELRKLNDALNIAISSGYSDVVEELIKGGADINYVDKYKGTPLLFAIRHAEATQEFSAQAQARARSRWYERRGIIQTLLRVGANVSHANKDGTTALMEAVIRHDLNTVQSLLQVPEMTKGSSYFGFGTKPINYADNDGNTALILAIKSVRCSYIDNQEYKICENSQNIINALLQTPGIDLHHVNKNGDTAIKLLKKLEEKNR